MRNGADAVAMRRYECLCAWCEGNHSGGPSGRPGAQRVGGRRVRRWDVPVARLTKTGGTGSSDVSMALFSNLSGCFHG
jgi:hypothetical protein